MLVYEAKLKGTIDQYEKLDEAIGTGLLFVMQAFGYGWTGELRIAMICTSIVKL